MNFEVQAIRWRAELDQDLQFLAGGGELGARMRAFDWAATSLGPAALWPRSLKTAVRIMLTSRQPIWIGWGKDLIYLYNDPYKSIIGGKHPWALGRPTSEVWREIWTDIGPMLATAMRGDEGTYVEEQLLIMERSGYPEETYYTFSYSPIPDDDGGVGGIICANTDDTRRVIGERQLALLREVAAATADARTVEAACERSAAALATDPRDLPFAMLYLVDPDSGGFSLMGAAGIARGHPAAPQSIALDDASTWPLAAALRESAPQAPRRYRAALRDGLPARAPGTAAPVQAALIPIPARGETARAGVLVAGLNPFRLFDDDYRRFLALAAGEIGAGIANAQAYEEERRRAEALAEIDRAKTAFFSNVSHEFRTPLTLMLGPLEDALNDALRGAARSEAARAARGGASQFAAPAEAGQQPARFLPHRGRADARELPAHRSRPVDGRARVEFRARRPSAPASTCGSIARRFPIRSSSIATCGRRSSSISCRTPSSSPFAGEIAVETKPSADRAAAELTVRDTGTGIPADELPRLFERFHRIEGAKGRTFEGSGIGLALVSELVKLHGGTIRVDSEVGRGTSFTVRIPFGSAHLPRDRVVAATGGALARHARRRLRAGSAALAAGRRRRIGGAGRGLRRSRRGRRRRGGAGRAHPARRRQCRHARLRPAAAGRPGIRGRGRWPTARRRSPPRGGKGPTSSCPT